MTITIDGPRSLALLHEATALRGPDFRYYDLFPGGTSGCDYTAVGPEVNGEPGEITPGCLIAVALHCAGVDLAGLRPLVGSIASIGTWRYLRGEPDNVPPDNPATFAAAQLEHSLLDDQLFAAGVELSEEATRIWWAAQRAQDDGHAWGDAVAFAENVAAQTQQEAG